ncbi:MAG: bifunctional metallophosphatase/5'-nucleotidase [bacterium]
MNKHRKLQKVVLCFVIVSAILFIYSPLICAYQISPFEIRLASYTVPQPYLGNGYFESWHPFTSTFPTDLFNMLGFNPSPYVYNFYEILPWQSPLGYLFAGIPGLTQMLSSQYPQSTHAPGIYSFYSSEWPFYLISLSSRTAMPMVEQVQEITLIHIGDLHGHLIPRAHMRSDSNGLMRGGLARMFAKIMEIRSRHARTLLVNCGDTIQGSAEALYTRGQALLDVLAPFKIDAFAPGNWDYLYGTERFIELFAPPTPIAPWGALAANLYYDGPPYAALTGQRVLPPYRILDMNGIRVGILGFTAERGPMVVYSGVVQGFRFTRGDLEVAEFVPLLREVEKVDLLVMISELGLANNIRLAETVPGIDVILSSDMHEETWRPVITRTGTIVVEEGTDGTLVGELTLKVRDRRVISWDFTQHIIDSLVPEDQGITWMIADIRSPFVAGPGFRAHINPINGTPLKRPIDSVIGHADIPLYRANFSHEGLPGVVEGSSHDFLTDAFRTMGQADVGSIRGFRYGTHIAPGLIKLEDIYHFIPIGPFIARGEVTGLQIKLLIENNADGSLNSNVEKWGGGWLYGWSGLIFDLDPYAPLGERARNIMILDWETNIWHPLDPAAIYTHASYNFAQEPTLVNKIPAANIQPILGPDGIPLDATEVVAEYLKTHTANPQLHRIRLLRPLPLPAYNNPEVQPLWGCPIAPPISP